MEERRVGRPKGEAARAHQRILDAVYELLQCGSARELTMEAVAQRAGVGKPTLYKWWPSKAALILAMFSERLALPPLPDDRDGVEATIRTIVRRLIEQFHGLFGKVMADLIAEGQSEHAVLHELYMEHIRPRRAALSAQIERAKETGEIARGVQPELVVDAIFGALYYRLLLRIEPFDQAFGDALVAQVFRGLS